ncbi:hypothetical protein, conserved [Babesia ovata]|uniref:Uncharacterized protein n=1 Tax=Babesia ovata TaxID=189622 RepID=A0A2H6K774_9APIC|nr:uncharacterized protein BOVATA_003340 [Babesia ovata]GBE58841.1 hypothetical protein, conserved [Babesia ovata]
MVYNSLTEAPRNLKECFDWLVALNGSSKFNTQALGFAVYNFLVDKPVGTLLIPSLEKVKRLSKEFLEQKELKNRPYVEELLSKYKEPVNKQSRSIKHFLGDYESDYKNVVKRSGVKPDDIAENVARIASSSKMSVMLIGTPDQYESAYSSEATWDASCSKDPEACAVIFVGIAPMLYAGLQSLWDETTPKFSGSETPIETNRMGKLMKALGFTEPEYRGDTSRSHVRRAVRFMHQYVLEDIYDLAGFWAFY